MFQPEPLAFETGSLAAEIEFTSPSLTVKWVFDRQLVIYDIHGNLIQDSVVDAWYHAVKRTIEGWDAQLPYLAIHDARNASFYLTPLLSARSRTLSAIRRELTRHVVVIAPKTVVTQILSVMLHAYRRQTATYSLHFAMNEAVRSLLPYLRQLPPQ